MRFKKLLRVFSAACVLGLLAVVASFTPVMAVGAVTSITPTVVPGGTVYISGSGFSGTATAVNVAWTGGGATATPTGGFFSAYFTVPIPTAAGTYQVVVTDNPYTTTAYSSFNVALPINFTLSASSGFSGDSVTVTGSGYTAGAVSFYWNGAATSFASLTAPSSGLISGTITIPPAARGTYNITTSQGTASQPFTVASKIVLTTVPASTPPSGGTGTLVNVTGTGFAAAPSNVAILLDGVALNLTNPPTINATSTGTFSCSFTMPSAFAGPHTITASDNGGSASAIFTVVPNIYLSSTSGTFGINVLILGSGFSTGEPLTVSFENTPSSGVFTVVTITGAPTTDSSGAFINNPISFPIPGVAGGNHLIKVTDRSGNFAVTTLTVMPTISITPVNGTVGTQVTVTGTGFAPGLGVNIFWDTTALTTVPATVAASSTGTISATFVSPASFGGPHAVKAQDTLSNSATATFTAKPKVVLTPATGGYGDTVSVAFTGFAPGSTIASTGIISGANQYALATTPAAAVVDASGSGTFTFSVGNLFFGNWTVQVSDSAGGSAQAILAVTPKIGLSVTTGSAGDIVIATGTGFATGRGVGLTYNGVALASSQGAVTSDTSGAFSYQFTVPATAAGTIPVKFSDGGNSATASFVATAKALVSKTATRNEPGYVGMDLTVSGTGFKPSSDIVVTFESAPVTVATVSSDAGGSFTATFKVPVAPSGSHTIHVTDGTVTKDFAFFMDSTAPAVVTAALPLDKAKPKQPVAFTWNAVTDPSGVTYTFQVSQDPLFSTLILEKPGLVSPSYTMTAAEKLKSANSKAPYYWRVRATDLAGNVGTWSASSTLTIGFIWPSWMIYVWGSLAIIVALIFGLWFGRRMAYQSY